MSGKPFTLRERRRMSQDFGLRPTNDWGSGSLPAPWCSGDVVELVGEPHERLRGQPGPFFVVSCAFSIGPDDEWYFRIEDGTLKGYGSDRLHVFPGTDWMEPFRLVETPDPGGLAEREQMLAAGWSYTEPPSCTACGQRLPRSMETTS